MEAEVCCIAPKEWQILEIGNVCSRVTSGGTPSRQIPEYYKNGKFGWVKSKELLDRWIEDTEEHITDDALMASSAKLLPQNTLLLALYGATVGQLGILKRPMTCNQACCAMIVDDAKADFRYLFYQLFLHRNQFKSLATGAAQQNLSGELIKYFRLPFPKLKEQKAIAATLSSFDDKIELLRRQNKTLETIAQTIFKEWFVKFKVNGKKQKANSSTGLPEGWRMGKLGDVIEIYGGGTPKTNLSEYWNGVIPWFSVVDVPSEGNIFVIKCEKHITQKGLENSSTRMLPVNATIITARGTVGKLALVGVPMAMNQSCYGIYPKDSKSFFYIYLMIKDSLTMLKQQVHGAVFDTITRDTLNNISVNTPTNKIIELFEDTITPCFHKVLQNNFQIQTLSKLRDTLLPKLMKGEIRVKS